MIDVLGRLFEKSFDKFDDDFLRDNLLILKRIEIFIVDFILYLLKCRFEYLKDEVLEEDYGNEFSVFDFENVYDIK